MIVNCQHDACYAVILVRQDGYWESRHHKRWLRILPLEGKVHVDATCERGHVSHLTLDNTNLLAAT